MKMNARTVVSVSIFALTACAHAPAAQFEPRPPLAGAELKGSLVEGTVTFLEERDHVHVAVTARGATKGVYYVLITSTPKTCSLDPVDDVAPIELGPMLVADLGVGRIEAILHKDSTGRGIESLERHAVLIAERGGDRPEACGEVERYQL